MRKGKRFFGSLALFLAAVGVSSLLCEAVARASGHHPYSPNRPTIAISPGGVLTAPDAVLGFTYLPGRFRVTFDNGDSWLTTHGADTLRVTRPVEAPAPSGRPGLWVFGCSFIHGWGLNDDEALPWKLQARLPRYDVVNFGVGGYSTVQSLLELRRALLERAAPAVVILAYAGFHDERNTLARRWRKGGFEYEHLGTTAAPYANLEDGELRFLFDRPSYAGFGLLRMSALAELVDEAYAPLDVRLRRSHRVSECLVDAFSSEATRHGVRFVVVGISREPETEAMLAYAARHGIPSVDASVDLTRWTNRIRWDGHPNGVANDKSAAAIAGLLEQLS